MKKKIVLSIILLLIASWVVWARTYRFNVVKATTYLTNHGRKKSKTWCACYTMRALQAGGCPAILLPAQWYSWFMPIVGFKQISKEGYIPKAGDVVVFQRPKGRHPWGHIAMYNGSQWISDYKQKKMSPYKYPVPYRLYRNKNTK